MTKTTSKTKPTAKTPASNSQLLLPSHADAKVQFMATIRPDDATNEAQEIAKFLRLMDTVISNSRSFTFSDIQQMSKPYQIDAFILNDLLERWLEVMERLGKATSLLGCYSEKVICLV